MVPNTPPPGNAEPSQEHEPVECQLGPTDPIPPPAFPWLPALLQTADPLFPIGSYAHSYGLEELAANGRVTDAATLLEYLQDIVALNLQEFELPYLRFARDAIAAADADTLCELDDEIGASKLSKELRAASVAQGRQRLKLIAKLRPTPSLATLQQLHADARIAPHHITVFAAESADAALPLEAALATWAYQAFAAPCAAALKLVRIGQEGAQTTLTAALDSVGTIVTDSLSVHRAHAGAFLPMLDIASHRHERAFSRLFIS